MEGGCCHARECARARAWMRHQASHHGVPWGSHCPVFGPACLHHHLRHHLTVFQAYEVCPRVALGLGWYEVKRELVVQWRRAGEHSDLPGMW